MKIVGHVCVSVAGTKQNGGVLGDVLLPPWAKGDPYEFIRMHREVFDIVH